MVYIIFLYFVLFPFGQLLRFNIAPNIAIYPTDLVIGLGAVLVLLDNKRKFPIEFKYFLSFIAVCVASLILSLSFFSLNQILVGSFYLIRIAAYFIYLAGVYKLAKKNDFKWLILNSLIAVGVVTAIFGWIQYLLLPDTTWLWFLGWDDHAYRLISTFLDPAFTGILLVFSTLLVLSKKKLIRVDVVLVLFLMASVAFTYSRASFLALIIGILMLRKKMATLLIPIFLVGIVVLPRPVGEGVRLERTYSILQKLGNYKESAILVSKSPVVGLGFNNICAAKQQFLGVKETDSHSCSGLDNSVLFVLATTGVVGLMLLGYFVFKLIQNTSTDIYGGATLATLAALGVHGMFTNTFFYIWAVGFLVHLIAISRKN